jgi:hypothetical protein
LYIISDKHDDQQAKEHATPQPTAADRNHALQLFNRCTQVQIKLKLAKIQILQLPRNAYQSR